MGLPNLTLLQGMTLKEFSLNPLETLYLLESALSMGVTMGSLLFAP